MDEQNQMDEAMCLSYGYRQVGATVHGGGLDETVMRDQVHRTKGWLWFDFGDHTRYYSNGQEEKQSQQNKEAK